MNPIGNNPLVVDPRLAAPRGEKYSAGALAEDETLEDDVPVHYYPEGQAVEAASTSRALDESNKGFKLLQKMGWKGQGLGKQETGIVEPVAAGVESGVRLGLGKQQQDEEFTAAEAITRKKLEVEIQAEEDPERTRRRELQVEREQRIKEDVSQIMKTFYCEICNKQYANAMEVEEHLSSYDHHHKKRLMETKAMMNERNKDERQRREARQQAKEQARLQKQVEAARVAAAARQQQQQQHPAPPLPPGGGPGAPTAAGAAGAAAVMQEVAPPPPSPPPPLPPGEPDHHQQQQQPMSISFTSMGAKPRVGKLNSARTAPAAAAAGGLSAGGGGSGGGSIAGAPASNAAAAVAPMVLGVKRKGRVLAGGLRSAPKVQMFQESSSDEEGGKG